MINIGNEYEDIIKYYKHLDDNVKILKCCEDNLHS